MRLDRALSARGLARSRTHAHRLIVDGAVRVRGVVVTKPAIHVGENTDITVVGNTHYVSRGALKLDGALNRFSERGLEVRGRACLDAGASTGGFTQVLLERGATKVLAVDVGHEQLAVPLRHDARVVNREGVNVRELPPPDAHEAVDVLTADLSFISLAMVIPALAPWLKPGGDALLMAKPQFEVGVEKLGKKGVVKRPGDRIDAVKSVAQAMNDHDIAVIDVARSELSGPAGNVEFFIWGRRSWQAKPGDDLRPLDQEQIRRAIVREVKGDS